MIQQNMTVDACISLLCARNPKAKTFHYMFLQLPNCCHLPTNLISISDLWVISECVLRIHVKDIYNYVLYPRSVQTGQKIKSKTSFCSILTTNRSLMEGYSFLDDRCTSSWDKKLKFGSHLWETFLWNFRWAFFSVWWN